MKYDKLDGIDKDWSNITFGCWQIAPSQGWGDRCSTADAERVVKTALDEGITAFDTAEGYGDGESERRLGKALGTRKDDVVIISKIWPDAELTQESYQKHLDDSLKALGRDYVDLYLIHWPGDYFNTPQKSEKLCEYMKHLRQSGKAIKVGLSNFYEDDLDLLGDGSQEFDINQIEISLLERKHEGATHAMCEAAGLKYMAYSPTAKGRLARMMTEADMKVPTRGHDHFFQDALKNQVQAVYDAVADIANELNCKPAQVALAWVMNYPNVFTTIIGSMKPEQVQEGARAAQINLSQEHITRLNAASDQYQEALSSSLAL